MQNPFFNLLLKNSKSRLATVADVYFSLNIHMYVEVTVAFLHFVCAHLNLKLPTETGNTFFDTLSLLCVITLDKLMCAC